MYLTQIFSYILLLSALFNFGYCSFFYLHTSYCVTLTETNVLMNKLFSTCFYLTLSLSLCLSHSLSLSLCSLFFLIYISVIEGAVCVTLTEINVLINKLFSACFCLTLSLSLCGSVCMCGGEGTRVREGESVYVRVAWTFCSWTSFPFAQSTFIAVGQPWYIPGSWLGSEHKPTNCSKRGKLETNSTCTCLCTIQEKHTHKHSRARTHTRKTLDTCK